MTSVAGGARQGGRFDGAPTRRSVTRVGDPAASLLAIVTECAWISVLAAFLQTVVREPQVLGLAGLLPFAAAGFLFGRLWAQGARPRSPWPAIALTLIGGAIGWLASETVRLDLAAADFRHAFGDHPAGWCAGLAFLRGIAHSRVAASEEVLSRLTSVGMLLLGALVLAGGAVPEPWRARFLAEATLGVVVFVGAGVLGAALARVAYIAARDGFDWHGNRHWLALLVLAVLGVAVLALPLAAVAGPAIQTALVILAVPLLLVGLVVGFGFTSYRNLAIVFILGTIFLAAAVLGPVVEGLPSALPAAAAGADTAANAGLVGAAMGAAALVVAIAVLVIVLAAWMRRSVAAPGAVPEERTIDRREPEAVPQPPRARRRSEQRSEPVDAPGAYLALLNDLRRRPDAERLPHETPAEHAFRLRRIGAGNLAADLLAADYELARFGSVPLTHPEHRRAIARWRRLRATLARPERP